MGRALGAEDAPNVVSTLHREHEGKDLAAGLIKKPGLVDPEMQAGGAHVQLSAGMPEPPCRPGRAERQPKRHTFIGRQDERMQE